MACILLYAKLCHMFNMQDQITQNACRVLAKTSKSTQKLSDFLNYRVPGRSYNFKKIYEKIKMIVVFIR